MSDILIEFESPESGAYIHEMTDKIKMSFKDKDGIPYTLIVHKDDSDPSMVNIDIDLTFDGRTIGLESIWVAGGDT